MKGHNFFLIVDFVIQTILLIGLLYTVIVPIDNLPKFIAPTLAIWLIVTSTVNKIKYNNETRFLINRVWFIVTLIYLFLFIKIGVNLFLGLTFSIFTFLTVLGNYLLLIYEYLQLRKIHPQNTFEDNFEDILDDNKF